MSVQANKTIQEELVTKFKRIAFNLVQNNESEGNPLGFEKNPLFKVTVSHSNLNGGELCIGSSNRVVIETFSEVIRTMVNITKSYRERWSWKCLQYDFPQNLEKIYKINDDEFIKIFSEEFVNRINVRRCGIFKHYKEHDSEFLEQYKEASEIESRTITSVSEACKIYDDIEKMRSRNRKKED